MSEDPDFGIPGHMRTPPPTNIRGREVCMLARDWDDFGQAVAETWPQARYYVERDYVNDTESWQHGPEPPPVQFFPTLGDACRYPYRARFRVIVFDPDWQPQHRKTRSGWAKVDWYWLLRPPPHPSVRIWPGGYIRDRPVPHPDTGEIHFYLTPKDKAQLALAARFFRLFEKFAAGRKGLVRVRLPGYEVTAPVAKGSPFWCGYHAIEWAREDPKRVLFCTHGVFGTRPTGDVLPLTKPTPGKKSRRAGG
ncbi:hypothetical protein [Ferrovibrio sp.]|uniref:hypothetical protein n=1 Tax=Ferrovibrio sp. TaxID=1917215 RepID=UPI0035141935